MDASRHRSSYFPAVTMNFWRRSPAAWPYATLHDFSPSSFLAGQVLSAPLPRTVLGRRRFCRVWPCSESPCTWVVCGGLVDWLTAVEHSWWSLGSALSRSITSVTHLVVERRFTYYLNTIQIRSSNSNYTTSEKYYTQWLKWGGGGLSTPAPIWAPLQ